MLWMRTLERAWMMVGKNTPEPAKGPPFRRARRLRAFFLTAILAPRREVCGCQYPILIRASQAQFTSHAYTLVLRISGRHKMRLDAQEHRCTLLLLQAQWRPLSSLN